MTILGVDIWEGNEAVDINETTLHDGGVEFWIIRLNNMSGGHHLDAGFTNQWAQCASFIRIPYFVYNPWVSGTENYNWMMGHLPPNVQSVMFDIEVRKDGYSASEYGNQLRIFKQLVGNQLRYMNYTGAWFLSNVTPWPVNEEYWWARYLYALYPNQVTRLTWEQLKALIAQVGWNPGSGIPGPCRMWQCSGDRFILPGCSTVLDIDQWNGSVDELRAWAGGTNPTHDSWSWDVTNGLRNLGQLVRDPA